MTLGHNSQAQLRDKNKFQIKMNKFYKNAYHRPNIHTKKRFDSYRFGFLGIDAEPY